MSSLSVGLLSNKLLKRPYSCNKILTKYINKDTNCVKALADSKKELIIVKSLSKNKPRC